MYGYFDIGGTKTRVAVSHDAVSFGEPVQFDTPPLFEEGVRAVVDTVRRLAGSEPIIAVGGGVASLLDAKKTMLLRAPNLPAWVGRPFDRRRALARA